MPGRNVEAESSFPPGSFVNCMNQAGKDGLPDRVNSPEPQVKSCQLLYLLTTRIVSRRKYRRIRARQ